MQMIAAVRSRLKTIEAGRVDRRDVVLRNVARLGRLFGLNTIEREILAFLAMTEADEGLKAALKEFGGQSISELAHALGIALAREPHAVRRALSRRGILRSTRIVTLPPRANYAERVALLDGLADALLREHCRGDALVESFVRRSPAPTLESSDFAHAHEAVALLAGVLGGALRRRARGVNVLVHGAPGTGKTELARVIARDLRAPLYEVQDQDSDGDSIGSKRLARCALAQRLLARSEHALLLFDEIEDAFPRRAFDFLGVQRGSASEKSWTNRLLEENRVPTIWVANQVEQIDPAILRRFDLVLEMPRQPRASRRRLLDRRLGAFSFSPTWLDRLASDERLTPSHVDRVARIARLLPGRDRLEVTLGRAIESSLCLQGEARATRAGGALVGRYDVAYVNASEDLDKLTAALTGKPRASICLHGPPGTGKTAYTMHLADRLAKPINVERASEWLSMWVGNTEKAIATAFRRARDEKAILFIDEADSFLQSRERARASWEVTQVNELLVQIETFDGILVCATNLMSSLDPASLRRFEIKIRFGAMTAAQRWAMFLGLVPGVDPARVRPALDRCDGVTPGDFAAVARRLRLVEGEVHPDRLLAGLEEELALKPGGRSRAVGFGRDDVSRRGVS